MENRAHIDEAAYSRTSTERLQQLASDADAAVRWYVAENPQTPSDALALLALDIDASVQQAALDALQTRQTLRMLFRKRLERDASHLVVSADNNRSPS